MRPILLISAVSLALAAGAAAAPAAPPQIAPPPAPAPAPASPDQVISPEVNRPATDLSGLNLSIERDEVRMTSLRDAELAQENARIRAIKPALPFSGPTFLPPIFWSPLPNIHAPHVSLPKL